ncbi:hypothetical protein [Actinomadura madurae]|uniref:hypothetical protein n=1 Tax=Actinomadura madurae TaxID=1993 RepID=UPI0020D22489|nr:hypothetical protein [Actinomadura madurae]MCP9983986.1 hypothetical protein [Actinomadura madurae]
MNSRRSAASRRRLAETNTIGGVVRHGSRAGWWPGDAGPDEQVGRAVPLDALEDHPPHRAPDELAGHRHVQRPVPRGSGLAAHRHRHRLAPIGPQGVPDGGADQRPGVGRQRDRDLPDEGVADVGQHRVLGGLQHHPPHQHVGEAGREHGRQQRDRGERGGEPDPQPGEPAAPRHRTVNR